MTPTDTYNSQVTTLQQLNQHTTEIEAAAAPVAITTNLRQSAHHIVRLEHVTPHPCKVCQYPCALYNLEGRRGGSGLKFKFETATTAQVANRAKQYERIAVEIQHKMHTPDERGQRYRQQHVTSL